MPDNPTTSLVKTANSPALARVSNQLALTEKLLAKSEEVILKLCQRDGKYGFCDQFNNVVIDFLYEEVDVLSGNNGLLKVGRFSEWGYTLGYINRYGKEVVPLVFHAANWFHEDLAAVMHNFAWGFVDHSGEVKIPLEYEAVENFSEGLAGIKKNDLWGFVNKSGKVVISPIYGYVGEFKEGLAYVSANNKYGYVDNFGYIDTHGIQIIEAQYKWARDFSEGLAAVSVAFGKWSVERVWGFIDKVGTQIIAPQFKDVSYGGFREDLVGVTFDSHKWGFIDREGKFVIPAKYSAVDWFYNGRAEVELDGKKGYIDKIGIEYWED